MGDFRSKAFVVHQKQIDLPDVADQELLQAIGKKMASLPNDTHNQPEFVVFLSTNAYLLVASVTNLGHGKLALEPSPYSVINTLGFPP